jgi:antirestriction protein ArdC
MANQHYTSGSDKALERFADLMIDKISEVADDWQKPWFSNRSKGLPQNLSGRKYNGMNSVMLYLQCEKNNYTVPVFMTFNQARESGVMINKGEKSFPVVYWGFTVKGVAPDTEGKNITYEKYKLLSDDEKKKYKVTPFLKDYNVFNIQQTTFPEQKPEEWMSLKEKFQVPEILDSVGMFVSPEMDAMIGNQTWVCPIDVREGDSAYHTRGMDDVIIVPLKRQFKDGEAFYATLLHEMAHSTGEEHRLNREKGGAFGDPKYAKEELVAELTSAVCCQSLGIVSGIREDNAKYLKNWLGGLKEEPKFILSVLSDVNKASNMINGVVLKQEVSLEKDLTKGKEYIQQSGGETREQSNSVSSEEAINRKFNGELQLQIDGVLPNGHVYGLGKPGSILLSTGMPDLPIELTAKRLVEKSGNDNKHHHPFDISEMKNLPKAIQSPLAIFTHNCPNFFF